MVALPVDFLIQVSNSTWLLPVYIYVVRIRSQICRTKFDEESGSWAVSPGMEEIGSHRSMTDTSTQ